ncbi:hypothetical protein TRVL_00854 [Trypanosoma vivax]|uniref:Uncharacterized protein n=1 Tax=Trypanosoma vivax (strain Y486) TaxID=1055687 RepID=G0U0B3_TRYVY|nr:hypothetical protein TRVL_00854 [Trypanosoma vivax]CCC49511.1 conserved hypothetical protein [Trypanosoma vivax Y486]
MLCQEIKMTMPLGLFGFDQCTWNGRAGPVWEFWECSPCCGAPDGYGVIMCLLNSLLCCPFAFCKAYASSLNDICAVWPHFFCVLCFPLGRLFTRYNLRKKNGTKGNIIGDFCCAFCCLAPCACCQELRSMNVSEWRVIPECGPMTVYVPGCHFLR